MGLWPASAEELEREQRELALEPVPAWEPSGDDVVAGCFVASRDDRLWAAAAVPGGHEAVVRGSAVHGYVPGLLALREGQALDAAVSAIAPRPDVVLVNATGRDHPRRCGLAFHLGARLDLPTIGVTDRPLVALAGEAGAPLLLEGEVVGYVVRTKAHTRPVMVHAAWRTSPETARDVVLSSACGSRTPEPIRAARHAARTARARDEGRAP